MTNLSECCIFVVQLGKSLCVICLFNQKQKIMPNWVKHNVTIKGSKEEIARCYEQITKGENGFSFKNIIPMPERLNITCGNYAYIAEKWATANEEERKAIEEKNKITTDEQRAELQKYVDNITDYGFSTWYDWSIHNWGTKWDACEADCDCYEQIITITFDTAWSTPVPIFIELSKQYPSFVICVEYADEDLGCNCGTYAIWEGKIQEEESKDLEFACEMWCIDPEELDFYDGSDDEESESESD